MAKKIIMLAELEKYAIKIWVLLSSVLRALFKEPTKRNYVLKT